MQTHSIKDILSIKKEGKLMLRKFLFVLTFFALLLSFQANPTVWAESNSDKPKPVIIAQEKNFNILTATYTLKGDVEITHKDRHIRADYAQYSLVKQEVIAQGNIEFSDASLMLKGDSLLAKINDKEIFLNGNVAFSDANLAINSNKGYFNWNTKIAVFEENVRVQEHGQEQQVEKATFNINSGELTL